MQICLYKLEVRGSVAAVGTYDECLEVLNARWGWVPFPIAPAVLRVKMTRIAVGERTA